MIEINLLPGAGRQKKGRSGGGARLDLRGTFGGMLGRAKDPYLIAAVVSTIAAIAVVGVLYTTQSQREEELTAAEESAVSDSVRFANFARQRARAQATRDTVLRQINVIRAIDDDRYLWPHVLDEVSSALPQYTWLTALAFTGTPQGTATPLVVGNDSARAATAAPPSRRARGKNAKGAAAGSGVDTSVVREQVQLALEGQTVDLEAITRFMRQLEASPFIEGVQLGKSQLTMEGGREVTTFELKASYVRQDSTVRRVPLMARAAASPGAAPVPPAAPGN